MYSSQHRHMLVHWKARRKPETGLNFWKSIVWLQIQKDFASIVQYFQPRYNMCSVVSTLVWLVVGRKARQPTISL